LGHAKPQSQIATKASFGNDGGVGLLGFLARSFRDFLGWFPYSLYRFLQPTIKYVLSLVVSSPFGLEPVKEQMP